MTKLPKAITLIDKAEYVLLILAAIFGILIIIMCLLIPFYDSCGWNWKPYQGEIDRDITEYTRTYGCYDGTIVKFERECKQFSPINASKCLSYTYWEEVE